jgi:signal transduction histidine kinase
MARPLLLFYILVFYVLLQFSWWAYLLIDLNKEVITYRIDLIEVVHADTHQLTREQEKSQKELRKRILMVTGEGAVFLGLLLFGIYKTRESFNKQFRLARQQKNFLLSITHEFKSPLAAVKLNLQTMQKRQLEPEMRGEMIRRSLMETERIHLLVENALFAARLESDNFDLHLEKTDFSSFVSQTVREYKERHDHYHEIQSRISPSLFIKGDTLALSSLLYNLIENAEKYSAHGTKIEIALSKLQHEIILTVSDEGVGIAEEERHRIFEKFYRIGNEDTRNTKGTGLGLFIVKQVADLHKADLRVRSNTPKGSVFELRFPGVQ